jgi:hypothetical protein
MMAKDLMVSLEDRPGTLAEMGEKLGKAGVNMGGMCAVADAGKGIIHILVEDSAAARGALEAAGIMVEFERDVLVTDVADNPGELGKIARKIADVGVNIDLVYLTTKGKLVLGVSDIEKAKAAL